MTRIIRFAHPRETSGYECDEVRARARASIEGRAPNFIDPYLHSFARPICGSDGSLELTKEYVHIATRYMSI